MSAVRGNYVAKVALSLAVVVVVVAAVGGYIYVQTGAAVAADTRQDLRSGTELRSETLAQWVHRLKDHAGALAVRAPVEEGPEAVDGFVESESEGLPSEVVAVHYVDTGDWTAVASTADAVEGSDVSGRPWATEAGGDGTSSVEGDDAEGTVSAPYTDPVTGAAVVAVVRRLPDADRAVVLVVDLEDRSGRLDTFTEGSFVHVVNGDGTVVMSHRTDRIGEQNVEPGGVDSPAVAAGLNGSTGYVEMEMRGQVMTMGYAPVPGTDWVVMTHVPKRRAFALQREVTRLVVVLVAASLLGLGAVGAVLGRNTARSIRELSATATELADGDLDVELSTGRTDEIGDLYASFATMRDSLVERIEDAEAARRAAESREERIERLADHLEGKADEFSRVMSRAAAGDLTQRMEPAARSDAMAEIAREFNAMMDEIERTAARVKSFADEVAEGSEEVTHGAREVEHSSEQVTRSIQEISDGVASQNEQFQTVSESMRDVSATTEEIAAASNQVSETAGRTAATGTRGREAAEVAVEGMTGVEAEARESVEEIVRLQEQMDEIGDIVEFIRQVAEQTSVLALNANIEAARAGQAGEGFGVVADEVQALASETKDAADDIESLIESLQGQTERTAAEVRRTREEVADSADAVRNAVTALEEIAALAEETNAGVKEIHEASQQQADSTETVVAMVDEAAAVSEEMSGEAEHVAAAAEEQASALAQVTGNADQLADKARSLREQLDRFDTDVATDSSGADGPAGVVAPDDD